MLISELKSKLQKSLDFLETELAQIRTGRANPSLLESIQVDAYDSKVSIQELGSITIQEGQTILVTPWDKTLLNTIANAIRESDLKLNPVVTGDVLRVPIPPLTEDRRIELTKVVSQKVEDAKNSLRHIRQDAMKDIEEDFTAKRIGEDDKFKQKDDVEKVVKEYVSSADAIGESKKQDVLKV